MLAVAKPILISEAVAETALFAECGRFRLVNTVMHRLQYAEISN